MDVPLFNFNLALENFFSILEFNREIGSKT